MSRNPNMERILPDLKKLLGERLSLAAAVREHHGTGLTHLKSPPPDAVAFVQNTEEVSHLLRLCHGAQVPVIAFGAGTALEGHFLASQGGVCLDMNGMNRIVRLEAQDMDVTVEAGVTREQLNHHLRDQGLFFPIDPGADATLGGMAATRASGTNAVRYGTMRDNVLSLKVVLADGRVIKTGGRARKSAAGYDLTRLMIGSEGTLGIITELTLRLQGIPEAISAAVCAFDSLQQAVESVVDVIRMGIPIARIELLDEVQMMILNQYADLDYAEKPTLFMEFHGSAASVREQAEMVEEIALGQGGGDFRWSSRPEDRKRLWKARHDAFYAVRAYFPGRDFLTTDVCVPVSKLTECILHTREDIERERLTAPLVGHVGDGNFHLILAYDKTDPDEIDRVEKLNARLVERALRLGGTCTGEHGIGLGKKAFLVKEHGTAAVGVMKTLKRALDPHNILNPGKIF